MPWLTVDDQMCRHLVVSGEALQNMTPQELIRANYEVCQESVRMSIPDKKERNAKLAENRKWFRKAMKNMQNSLVVEVDSVKNNKYNYNHVGSMAGQKWTVKWDVAGDVGWWGD
jgi:hypothetical protein